MKASDIDIGKKENTVYWCVEQIRNGRFIFSFEGKSDTAENERWDIIAESKFIESLLLNIPTTELCFVVKNIRNPDTDPILYDGSQLRFKVIDGEQRILALKHFIVDKSFGLTGLDYMKQLEGMSFDELPDYLQRTLIEVTQQMFYIRGSCPKDVVMNIAHRINPKRFH